MPQQLIYTSAPRGLVAGRSGHCTVARSAAMREALVLLLEKLSYYQHLSLSGGRERPIHCCRTVDLRGSRYHVLTRIQDAGLDFTGRTNFLAHHLVFAPEEIRAYPSPPVILQHWPGWVRTWPGEPQLLESEEWSSLTALAAIPNLPAQTWQQVTGDAVNGYGLLEARTGASFRVDDQPAETVLKLFAESLELLEVRDARKDFRASAWQYTFTTSIQEQDNPADFRWRCLHDDNPAAGRFAAPDCRPLSAVRAIKWTREEIALASTGRQAPRFVVQPKDFKCKEGDPVRLNARAEGIPAPNYQWFSVDRANHAEAMTNGNESDLLLTAPPPGVSRYLVRVSNSQGETTSGVATISVEPVLKVNKARPAEELPDAIKTVRPAYVKSGEEIDLQRRKLEAERAQAQFRRQLRLKKIAALIGSLIFGLVILAAALRLLRGDHKQENSPGQSTSTNVAAQEVKVAETNAINPANAPAIVVSVSSSKDAETPSTTSISVVFRQPPANKLPEGWSEMTIGKVSYDTAEYISDPRPAKFVLTASGAGFSQTGDHFLFVCPKNSPKEFQANVSKITPAATLSRCGIMVRESASISSAFLFIGSSGKDMIACRRDSGQRLFTQLLKAPTNIKEQVMMKVEEKNGQYAASYWDGGTWQTVRDYTIAKNGHMLIGMALCSGSPSSNVTAHFVTGLK